MDLYAVCVHVTPRFLRFETAYQIRMCASGTNIGPGGVNYVDKADNIFSDATLYVVRLSKYGVLMNSAPCKNCMDVIHAVKIKRIIFTSSDSDIVSVRAVDFVSDYLTSGQRNLVF
jgi:tRNA(Arg) A34 adenosine deaminase TadA